MTTVSSTGLPNIPSTNLLDSAQNTVREDGPGARLPGRRDVGFKAVILGAFGSFLGRRGDSPARSPSSGAQAIVRASPSSPVARKAYLECGLLELGQVAELRGITGEVLKKRYEHLIGGCGGLSGSLHGLRSISRAGIEPFRGQAQLLLSREIAGFAARHWGGFDCVNAWVRAARSEDLERAATSLNQWADDLLAFRQSVQAQDA